MGCPPLSVGAVHDNEIDVAVLPVKTTLVGAPGLAAGVAVMLLDHSLVPSTVVCAIRNWYGVERMSPVMVAVVLVVVPSL